MMLSFQIGKPARQQESGEPKAKRAKISVACNICKARKTKCDGVRPVCGACSKRKQICIYREAEEASPLGVERTIGKDAGQLRDSNELPRTSPKARAEQSRSYQEIVPTGSLFGASSGAHIIPLTEKTTVSRSFFDSTTDKGAGALTKPPKELPKLRKRHLAQDSDMQFAIPPRKIADEMLNSYWDYVDSAYPWLDRPSIESAYETLWTKDGEVPMNERALHCILNLIFATSCVASQGQSLASRYESSSVFFDRAQQLMSCELMSIYNFEIIQILLLTAVYLQHERVPQKCFRNIGMAIHIAQELGLHLRETTEAIRDPRERGLARQVWNGCIIMDRLEVDLNNWAGSLHPFFQSPSDTADPTPTKHIIREANVLRARYLCVRLLLFRPFLLQIQQHNLDTATTACIYRDEQLLPHVVSQCQIHCIQAAADIIDFIVRNLPERTQAHILPSNWYTVSYVYMAVTVLLAAKMSAWIVDHFSRARLDSLLRQARDILKNYEQHTTLASRCSSVLGLIERNIDRRGSGDAGHVETWQSASDNDYTTMQDQVPIQQEPQNATGHLSWFENYTFDWNEWPTFFAQLDNTASPVDGWGISM
ncbi:hypothetical protein N7508_002817 [Penicillium antarcticum]|uniref:uncharacterized protein n=1 Tax=Penicillium antarcticum TaxID=416450 RepID=UPI00239FEC1C|nr:uncharacterized protein N7508_002817 [Penicillium antarcticum]KAJ5311987.1 hypothetical protein N7508_002817 [Penicillium antarcticum]